MTDVEVKEIYEIHLAGTGPKTGLTTAPGLPDLGVASIAEISRLKVPGYRDSASGRLVKGEDRRYRIDSVTLRPVFQVEDPTQVEEAHRLLDKAEEACLISRSISAEVILEPVVEVLEQGTAAR